MISMLAMCLKGFPERPKNLILRLEKEKKTEQIHGKNAFSEIYKN